VSRPRRPDGRVGLGLAGEGLAARHLERLGYRLLARRWRCPTGEIDLVMADGPTLVFVEVRTRRGEAHGAAVESITRAKAARLIRLAAHYLAAHPALGQPDWRIDLVAIQLDATGRLQTIEHLISAIEG
jgi:putative endonuclease